MRLARIGFLAVLGAGLLSLPAFATKAARTAPVRIAVFAFELDDESPAAALLNETTSTAAAMDKVNTDARAELAQSGRYDVIDASNTDMSAVTNKSFKSCDGCEAGIALKLGAQQSLIGIVKRATQTDYYIVIQIRDAHSGKVLDEQAANFAGGEEGWGTGARMLIRHQILPSKE
jgi:ABC-type proline/glycine betaine transport system substrate-binding protein